MDGVRVWSKVPCVYDYEKNDKGLYTGRALGKLAPELSMDILQSCKFSGKFDGTCCYIKENELYARQDLRPHLRDNPPKDWFSTTNNQVIRGHYLGFRSLTPRDKWISSVLVDGTDTARFLIPIYDADQGFVLEERILPLSTYKDCTVECVGEKFNKNPHKVSGHGLVPHGSLDLSRCGFTIDHIVDPEKLKHWLLTSPAGKKLEGVIVHTDKHNMFKVHRKHLGMAWEGDCDDE